MKECFLWTDKMCIRNIHIAMTIVKLKPSSRIRVTTTEDALRRYHGSLSILWLKN